MRFCFCCVCAGAAELGMVHCSYVGARSCRETARAFHGLPFCKGAELVRSQTAADGATSGQFTVQTIGVEIEDSFVKVRRGRTDACLRKSEREGKALAHGTAW